MDRGLTRQTKVFALCFWNCWGKGSQRQTAVLTATPCVFQVCAVRAHSPHQAKGSGDTDPTARRSLRIRPSTGFFLKETEESRNPGPHRRLRWCLGENAARTCSGDSCLTGQPLRLEKETSLSGQVVCPFPVRILPKLKTNKNKNKP